MSKLLHRLNLTMRVYSRWGLKSSERRFRRARTRWFFNKHPERLAIRFQSPGNGLFAHLSWCMHAAAWADRNERQVSFRCTSPQYTENDSGEDWLPMLLSQPNQVEAMAWPEITVTEFEQLPFFAEPWPNELTGARDLFKKHFAVAPPLAAAATNLARLLWRDRYVVGLHYRGTDKVAEAAPLPPEAAIESARLALVAARGLGVSDPVLFVATDERAFLERVRTDLPAEQVVSLPEAVRAGAGTALHKAGLASGNRLAREAMLDCLLLGKSRVLLKTASMLSAWSLLLERPASVVMLSQPYPHCIFFPDNLAIRAAFPRGQEAAAVRQSLEVPV